MGSAITTGDQVPTIILASASRTRATMLENAGLTVECIPAHVDEDAAKRSLKAEGATPAQIAEALAELKATRIAGRHPDRLVIGADQTLELGGELFDKPVDLDHAAAHLHAFSGRTHRLHAAVAVMRGDRVLWHMTDSADLTVRPLDDAFIARYLDAVGEDALGSVGAYRLEGLGAQLFESVRGDYFTVLGLPLLPLLGFLRQHGALAA
ncbi:septum formation protein Maf [Marivibrio halodurans]|uniref:Nucleoside triphosphate pyrophosphatase n=1 Tax=Marivibrio halodurans TaxID=2039722 RepID=A0A8J7S416_9PROT|nr:Maf family nucleotide pyrophosphatase [Marivibrio halodurans]MBP5858163.1 septum formation protein Maf [Marivibrio halodurans]